MNPYYPAGVTDRDIDNAFGRAAEEFDFLATVYFYESEENDNPQKKLELEFQAFDVDNAKSVAEELVKEKFPKAEIVEIEVWEA